MKKRSSPNSSEEIIYNLSDSKSDNTILSLRWPGLDDYLEQNQQMLEYIGDSNNGEIESKIPEDLIPLFHNKHVIDVVRGNA